MQREPGSVPHLIELWPHRWGRRWGYDAALYHTLSNLAFFSWYVFKRVKGSSLLGYLLFEM